MKHRKILWKSCVLILCLCGGYILTGGRTSDQSRTLRAGAVQAGRPAVSLARVPLSFEANQGQTDARVKFVAHRSNYTLFLSPDEVTLELRKSEAGPKGSTAMSALRRTTDHGRRTTTSVLRLKLVNANQNAVVTGASELPGKANYFIGSDPRNWRTNLPTYARVKYQGVYPGVDMVFYGNQRELENDFVISPGADATQIAFRIEGSKNVSLDTAGNLLMAVQGGDVQLQKPVIYQESNSGRREISGSYVLKGAREVAFNLGAYDPTKSLVIDPVLVYRPTMPLETGAVLSDCSCKPVTINPFLVYSTYVGGDNGDIGYAIAVDSSGDAYITGITTSANFPTTAGAFQTDLDGTDGNVFITKLNSTGTALLYSTYLGGSGNLGFGGGDTAYGIAVDSTGHAYVTGQTVTTDFPTTPGAFQPKMVLPRWDPTGPWGSAFVTKLNPSGSALVYSTYLGGNFNDLAAAIAVDSSGHAYVAGWAFSADFPVTSGAFQTILKGAVSSAFVTKFNPSGSALVYSTYIGGSGWHYNASSIAVDSSGNAYVAGSTDENDYPTTPGAFQTQNAGVINAVVTKLNPSGTKLIYSTYLGGNFYDWANAITLDSSGNAYVVGQAQSADFPTTAGAFQTELKGGANAFVAKLNPSGSTLAYSTYLGGSNGDHGNGIAVDSSGNAYVTGQTNSTDFPTTPGAYQTTLPGAINGFVTMLNSSGSTLAYSSYFGGTWADSTNAIALDATGNTYLTGGALSANFPTTTGAFQTSLAGGQNAFVSKLAISPPAQIANLGVLVDEIRDPVMRGFLVPPLQAALAESKRGLTSGAIGQLNSFIVSVRGMVFLRLMTCEEAQILIASAENTITFLGGQK